MIPESLLKSSTTQGVIVPRYLDERDYPWLRLLIEEYFRFVGSSKIELLKHLKHPLPFISPDGKRQLEADIPDKPPEEALKIRKQMKPLFEEMKQKAIELVPSMT